MTPCKFFFAGYCRRGDSCRYSHTTTPAINPQTHPAQDLRWQTPCRFFSQGSCRNGSACPYSHLAGNELETEESSDPEEIQDYYDITRDFCGALVHFECGAQVSKISFPADFSAVRITGLPLNFPPEYVSALFQGIGIGMEITPGCVRVFEESSQTLADIRFEHPTFARLFITTIDPKSFLDQPFSKVQAFQIPVDLSSGLDACRVECRKVQCSWYKTAWLNFGNGEIADRVFNKFKSKSYRILDQTVDCKAPTRSGGGRRNPRAWTLILEGVPIAATERDIYLAIHSPNDSPRSIEVEGPTYNIDDEVASATVMSLLINIGPVEWSQANTEPESKIPKAMAQFFEEEHAREAARTLHDKPLPGGTNMRLSVRLVITVEFKVAASIFSAVQTRIGTASKAWTKEHLNFGVYHSTDFGNQYAILKIEGLVAEDVATVKESVSEILDGITIMRNDGKPLWSHSLNSKGNTFQKLKKIQQDHDVIVICNRGKEELKLFGSPRDCVDAEAAIVRMIRAESSKNFKKRGFKGVTESDAEKDCAVCWTQAESPVSTKCGHVYCIECFERLCINAGLGEKDFSVTCLGVMGDMGKCEKPFDLEELQKILSSKAFEDILEASFTSYIKRHPQMFRYCPRPDCSMIYRADSPMKFNTCARCLTVTCTSCHAQHDGKTCAEYKDEASGGYQATQLLKQELDIKDCPNCETSVEKIEGCNHLQCGVCGTDFCWLCLKVFSLEVSCYDHMRAKHGGIGLNDLDNGEF